MRLNKTDNKLIAELQRDGSLSYAELAGRLDLATRTVGRRVQWLLSAGVISIIGQPNPYKLGLSASALLGIKTDPAKNDEIFRQLQENFHVNHIQYVFGRFDIIAMVFYPSWNQLHQFIYEDLYLIPGVKRVEAYIVNDIFKRYERFFQETPFETDQARLTSTDWALICSLAKDARTKPSKLADELGVHKSTVYRRIEYLLTGDFLKIRAIPNPTKLSSVSVAFIVMEVGSADIGKVCRILQEYDEIHFVLTANQQSCIVVFVHASDTYALYQFTKEKILGLHGINGAETFIGAAVRKLYYAQMDYLPNLMGPG